MKIGKFLLQNENLLSSSCFSISFFLYNFLIVSFKLNLSLTNPQQPNDFFYQYNVQQNRQTQVPQMMHQMQQPMQQQMSQQMNGVPMMPTMMNQGMTGIGMNQFNANIPMASQPPNQANAFHSMNPMNSINPMNSMGSLNPMNSMSSMNSFSSINTISQTNSMNSVPSMNSMDSLMPMGTNMNQFQQMPMGNNQFQFQNPRRLSQNSIQNGSKPKKSYKQMYGSNAPNPAVNNNPVSLPPQPKKKSSKLSQPKVSIVQPPITQPQPPVSGLIPSSGINTPQTPIIPPKVSPQNAQMPTILDNQRFMSSITRLTDDKRDLLFRLFECNSKRKEERIENFKSNVLVKMSAINPNFPALLHSLVLSMANDYYTKLKDPPLPLIFSRAKRKKLNGPSIDIHPTYKFIQLSDSSIEIQPKEKKSEPLLIASFISFNEISPPTTLIVGKEKVQPLQYGSYEYYYPLVMDGKVPNKIQVMIQNQNFPFLTWLVVHYVRQRSALEVLHDLMTRSGIKVEDNEEDQILSAPVNSGLIPNSSESGDFSETQMRPNNSPSHTDLCVFAKTPKCNSCSFQLLAAIDDIIKNGSSSCPSCCANIILNDLILEVNENAAPEATVEEASSSNFIDSSNKEVYVNYMLLGDQICSLMSLHPKEPNWNESISKGDGVPVDADVEQFNFSTTDGYIKKINELM